MGYQQRTDRSRLVDAALFWHHRKIWSYLRPILEEHDQPGRRILEIGPGARPKKTHFVWANTVSIDIERWSIVDIRADVTSLPFQEDVFDFVICENVLEHVSEPAEAINEVARVMHEGGHLFLVTPFLFPVHDPPFDFFRYTEYSLRLLLSVFDIFQVHSIPLVPGMRSVEKRFPLYYVVVATR